MSIFPANDCHDDVLIMPTGPEYEGLRTSLTALVHSHRAPSGCQPTAQQINDISFRSGAAVVAIMQALNTAAQAHAEPQH